MKRIEEVKNGKREKGASSGTSTDVTTGSQISGVSNGSTKNNEKQGQGNILFENLVGMANTKLEYHTEKLKRKIDKLARNPHWIEMTKYEQPMVDRVQQSGSSMHIFCTNTNTNTNTERTIKKRMASFLTLAVFIFFCCYCFFVSFFFFCLIAQQLI